MSNVSLPYAKAEADICAQEDFGTMLASYGIARIIQTFPNISMVPGDTAEEPGTERQHLTLTLSNVDGCKVVLG